MRRLIVTLIIVQLLASCALFVDEYQENQRAVIAYLLSDFPMPDTAKIIKTPTVVLGTGSAISGRIVLEAPESPAEALIYYANQSIAAGWTLVSSKVGEEITMVYTKEGRYATINITPQAGVTGFVMGSQSSDIIVSVVHPAAVDLQNPFEGISNSIRNAAQQ